MPSHTSAGPNTVTYDFGLDPRTERLALPGGGSWTFFSATFSAGGSGTLDRLAILDYRIKDSAPAISNLLPFVGLTNISERAMWTIPAASAYPILVDADFIWGNGESHFENHRYTVEAWRYDPANGRYARAFGYRTAHKYKGDDERSAPVGVLKHEREEILRRLGAGQ